MTEQWLAISSLFFSAFISATIAPGGSEAVLVYWVNESVLSPKMLVFVATIGNTLGAITTWVMGWFLSIKFPVDSALSKDKQRAVDWVRKWGRIALLFSWAPVIGDALCFAGGWLRLPVVTSILIIMVGKALRYAAVVLATQYVIYEFI